MRTITSDALIRLDREFSRTWEHIRYTAWLVVLGLALTGLASTQNSNSGEIRGVVTDQSGAAVPEVIVTILNTETGVSRNLATNGSGLYDAVSIIPGSYQITFNKEGFDKLVRRGINLTANAITVDAQLKVGTAQQEVEVTEEAPLLQTESSQQSTTLESRTCSNCRTWGRIGATSPEFFPAPRAPVPVLR